MEEFWYHSALWNHRYNACKFSPDIFRKNLVRHHFYGCFYCLISSYIYMYTPMIFSFNYSFNTMVEIIDMLGQVHSEMFKQVPEKPLNLEPKFGTDTHETYILIYYYRKKETKILMCDNYVWKNIRKMTKQLFCTWNPFQLQKIAIRRHNLPFFKFHV